MKKIVTLVILLFASPLYAVDLTIYTEEFPPFNYTRQGRIAGVSTEVVEHVMAATGYNVRIKSLPWSEAYEKAQKEENALIYSISRRKNREQLFKWIGILTPTTYSVKALASRKDIRIGSLLDMKHYKIGTKTEDATENWLLGNGFEVTDFTRVAGKNAVVKSFKNLMNRQIDVWPSPDAVVYYIARQQGHSNPDAIINKVYPLEELSGGYYLAGSRSTSDEVITTVRNALAAFKKTDKYYKILGHWGVDAMGLKTTEPITKLVYAFKRLNRITKVGYLADDKLSSHREGGLYRKEMREEFVEMYSKDFNTWQENFLTLQNQVDALIIGDMSKIRGWSDAKAKQFALNRTRIPTGFVLDGMGEYTLLGYDGDDLVVNMKIADHAGIDIPKSIVKKAARVIR